MTISVGVERFPKPWTKRQALFATHYLADKKKDATSAAIKAGYSSRSAKNQAHRMMTHDDYSHVREWIWARAESMTANLEISAEETLRHVAAIAHGNLWHFIKVAKNGLPYIDFENVTEEHMLAIASIDVIELAPIKQVINGVEVEREVVKVRIKLQNKLHALEMLMKHLGLHKERVEHMHSGKVDLDDEALARRIAFILSKAHKEATKA